MEIRTRMAPSPTGEYHVGHIRTVLYNYAFAKQNGGKFIIRIEDTDRNRLIEGAMDRILDVISSLGLTWDEGPRVGGPFAPYIQSERLPIYIKYAEELIAKGHAYYCFCTEDRLNAIRKEQQEKGVAATKYDRHCVGLSPEDVKRNLENKLPYVIRLKVPDNEDITFKDVVYGEITINSKEVDDQVLLKSDGYPTYQLAVVVDDHLMGITHVMRGNDWISSTPKHVILYRAFGWEFPVHIHLPNLKEVGGDKKLSKRFGSVAVVEFLKEGYLPKALLNFLMFLGWNPGTEKEVYSMDEFVKDFDLKRIQNTDLVAFDRQKLEWMNGLYLRNLSDAELLAELVSWTSKYGIPLVGKDFEERYQLKVISQVKDRMKTLKDYAPLAGYFYEYKPLDDEKKLWEYCASKERALEILKSFKNKLETFEESSWNYASLDTESHKLIEELGYKPKEAFMTLRVALTSETATPHIFDVMEILGKRECLKRLESALG